MRALGGVTELAHVAQHGESAPRHRRVGQQPQGHLQRLGVGVVAVIDDGDVSGQLAALESPADRPILGEPLDDVAERYARGERRGGGGQRVGHGGFAEPGHLDVHATFG